MGIDFKFEFRSPFEFQKGVLANVEISLWADNLCIVSFRRWTVRDGQNGPWAAPPSFGYGPKDGNGKHTKFTGYVSVFPKMEEGKDSSDAYSAFQNLAVQKYNEWVANGMQEPSYNSTPANNNARSPGQRSVNLPEGWSRTVDTKSNTIVYISPNGEAFFDGDPRLESLLVSGGSAPKGNNPYPQTSREKPQENSPIFNSGNFL